MVPRLRNKRGLQTRLCEPSLRPPKGPDVRLPKIVTLRWRDVAARAVIGPLSKTRHRTKTDSQLRRSVCMVLALRERGTIISSLGIHSHSIAVLNVQFTHTLTDRNLRYTHTPPTRCVPVKYFHCDWASFFRGVLTSCFISLIKDRAFNNLFIYKLYFQHNTKKTPYTLHLSLLPIDQPIHRPELLA